MVRAGLREKHMRKSRRYSGRGPRYEYIGNDAYIRNDIAAERMAKAFMDGVTYALEWMEVINAETSEPVIINSYTLRDLRR